MGLSIDETATLWSSERAGLPLVVLLHGYGADEHDLFGLIPHLPDRLAFAALAAPLAPAWPQPGRAWYPLDGVHGGDDSAVTDAARAVLEWVAQEAQDAPAVAMLGFSQGAAVSLQAMRLDAEGSAAARIDAVVALSGYAAEGTLPGDDALREHPRPVFWGRGTDDEVIPEARIAHTAQWLPTHTELSGRVYPGLRHGVSADEILDVRIFLERWRDRAAS